MYLVACGLVGAYVIGKGVTTGTLVLVNKLKAKTHKTLPGELSRNEIKFKANQAGIPYKDVPELIKTEDELINFICKYLEINTKPLDWGQMIEITDAMKV